MSDMFKPMFNLNLLKARVGSFTPQLTNEQLKVVTDWATAVGDPHFKREKEKPHQGAFLIQIFAILLGYDNYTANPENYSLKAETASGDTKGGKAPDGRLGFYGKEKDLTRVVIELKPPAVNLDGKQAAYGGMTPVEQAFGYASKFDGCRWVIVSNFITLRLYGSARGQGYWHEWNIAELRNDETLREFLYCLEKDRLISEAEPSVIDQLAQETHTQEDQITKDFYRFYSQVRTQLFDELIRDNPPSTATERISHEVKLLERAQKILDRVLFICFAEDRGLLPYGLIRKAFEAARGGFVKTSRWQQMLGLFDAIDKGNPDQSISGYDGGLFQHDPELAVLKVSEEFLDKCLRLSEYDFLTDLNVNILGHVFEQSISDLEVLRGEIQGAEIDKTKSRRKKEGIFYTPDFVTRFIVESTVGSWLMERFSEIENRYRLETVRGAKRKAQAEKSMWEDYRTALWNIKIVDPACGSGAFLVAAFNYLLAEYTRVNDRLSELEHGQTRIFDWDRQILQENLYGVDLNSESVEITKLSLWLKTARKNKPLDNLDSNIKCGNSIIPRGDIKQTDEILAAYRDLPDEIRDRAFDWPAEFPEVFARGGFDCVVGNPPYIRQERLSSYKPYFHKAYKCFSSSADLYIYFFEQGLSLLKQGGRLGYITSGTFARTSFAAPFRKWLPQIARFEKVVNFGENQPFADAEMVHPTISVLTKGTHPKEFKSYFMHGSIPDSIGAALETAGVDCDDQLLLRRQWLFQSQRITDLCDRIMSQGSPLAKMDRLRMHSGLKTGLNEAFVVDQETCDQFVMRRGLLTGLNEAFVIDRKSRDQFIADSPDCAAILRRLLAGEDLRPWYQENQGNWLILIPDGMTARASAADKESAAWNWFKRKFAPVAEHLSKFERKGRLRADKGQFWWELRSCDYYDAFDNEKIVWPDISKLPRFSWEPRGYVLSNTGYVMTGASPWLLSILQSRLIWFCISQISTPLRLRGGLWQYRCIRQFIEKLPIVVPGDDECEALAALALRASATAEMRYELHQSVRHRVQTDLGHEKSRLNQKLEKWWTISFPDFRKEVGRALGRDMPLRERPEWEQALGRWREEHDRLTSELVNIEEELNNQIYALYSLSDTDVQLLEDHCHKAMIYYSYGEP